MFKHRRVFFFLCFLILSVALFACDREPEDTVHMTALSVDPQSVEEHYEIGDFRFSDVRLIVERSDGSTYSLNLEPSMIEQDLTVIESPGSHTFTIQYYDLTTTLTIDIIEPEPETFTVIFKDHDGTVLKEETIEYGQPASPPDDPVRVGFVFLGWTHHFDYVSYDMIIWASYEPEFHTVTFFDQDGSIFTTREVAHGEGTSAPPPPLAYYELFIGWDQSLSAVTADMDVHPIIELFEYQVTFRDRDYFHIGSRMVKHGHAADPPVPPEIDGHRFVGWSEDVSDVTQPMDVFAVYELREYTVVFKDYDGTILHETVVTHGETATAPADPSRAHHDFEGWDHELKDITGDLIIHAQYAIHTYIVIFTDETGSVLEEKTVEHGASVEAPGVIPEKTGHSFIAWSESLDEIIGDLTVHPLYEPNIYTITFDTMGGESLEPIALPYGEVLPDFEIPYKQGYALIGWYLDDAYDAPADFDTMPLDGANLYAKWEIATHTIHFETFEGSGISAMTVQYGEVIEALPEAFKDDYYFHGWRYQDNPVELPLTMEFEEDVVFEAIYTGLPEGTVYQIIDGGAHIESYTGTKTHLYYPDTIEGYPVLSVGNHAFSGNDTVVYLELPALVESLGQGAFSSMSALETIVMPSGATIIDTPILEGADALRHLMLSSAMPYSLDDLFGASVPDTLELIEYVRGCSVINNTLLTSPMYGTVLKLASDWVEVGVSAFEGADHLEHVIIPEGIETIRSFAFADSGVKTVEFPSTLTTIESDAFRNSVALEVVYLPDTITTIETRAFINVPRAIFLSAYPAWPFDKFDSNFYPADINELYWNMAPPSETISGLKYGVRDENSVVILGVGRKFKDTDLIIPSVIDGRTVDRIAARAFKDDKQLLRITLPVHLTRIPAYAFENAQIEEVIIPEDSTITVIDFAAFRNTQLTHFVVPATVELIRPYAFAGSAALKSVTFESGHVIQSWGFYVFSETGIEAIVIPNNIETIPSSAFRNATNLHSVTFAETSQVETIESWAFQNTALTEIALPKSLTHIGNGAFTHNEYLQSVVFETGTNLESLGESIFANNYALLSIALPGTFTSVPSAMFDGASNLESVQLPDTVVTINTFAFRYTSNLETIELPDSLGVIGTGAFEGSGLREIAIPPSVEMIRREAFRNAVHLAEVRLTSDTALSFIELNAFRDTVSLRQFIIPDTVVVIGYDAFRGERCPAFTIYIGREEPHPDWHENWDRGFVGEQVFGIEDFGYDDDIHYVVFGGNATITGARYNRKVIHAGEDYVSVDGYTINAVAPRAFKNNNVIEAIYLGHHVETIGEFAFKDAVNLHTFDIDTGYISLLTTIGEEAFKNAVSLTAINLTPAHELATIGVSSFKNTPSLMEVSLYYSNFSLTVISEHAFEGSGIETFLITRDVHTIGASAFKDTPNLTHVEYYSESYLEIIGPYAFYNSGLTAIEIPMFITEIGEYAFANTGALQSVDIHINASHLTEIKNHTFHMAEALHTFNGPSVLNVIGDHAFDGTAMLKAFDFTGITTIGASAFSGSALESPRLPTSVTTIGADAFALIEPVDIYVVSTEPQPGWSATWNTHHRIVWNADDVHFVVDGHYIIIVGADLGITTVEIPATFQGKAVHRIEEEAFKDHTELMYVFIAYSSTLNSIGARAFENCSSLRQILIPEGVYTIGENAFKGCTHEDFHIYAAADGPKYNWHEDFNPEDATIYYDEDWSHAYP